MRKGTPRYVWSPRRIGYSNSTDLVTCVLVLSSDQIIKAYEMSTSTLRSVLSDPALQRERVDATMDALADALADQQEIDQAIQSGGQLALAGSSAGVDVDEDDLEKELEGLVQDKKREEEDDVKRRSDAKREEEQIVERAHEDREVQERLQRLRPAATAGTSISEQATKGDQTRREVSKEAA
jgi:charged multivesicular body protein 7